MEAPINNAPSPKVESGWGAGRVAFLAKRELIQKALAEGWSIQAVFKTYAVEVGIGYSQFARYVQRYITGQAAPKAKPGQGLQLQGGRRKQGS